jgi:hypothetical protein
MICPDERFILVILCSRVSFSSLIFEDQQPQAARDELSQHQAPVFARIPTLSIWDLVSENRIKASEWLKSSGCGRDLGGF